MYLLHTTIITNTTNHNSLTFSAMFAVLFPDKREAAFATYRLLQALGLSIGFGYSYFLCVSTKLYIVTSFFGVGIFLYSVLEYQIRQENASIIITLL